MTNSTANPADPGRQYGDFGGVLPLLDRTAAFRQAAELVRQDMDVDVSAAADRIDDADTVEIVAACGAPELVGLQIPPAQGLGGQAAILRHPISVSDYCASMDISHDFDDAVRAAGVRSVLAVPILRGHRLYGVLYAGRRAAGSWSDDDQRVLLDLARQTGLVVDVAAKAREMADVAVYTEQQRWAVHLHDTVGATLFGIRATLTRLRDSPELSQDLIGDIDKIHRLADRASTEIRSQLRNMHEPPADKALAVALHAECRELWNRAGIRAEVVILNDLLPLDTSRRDALVRAAREALLNTEKHANAKSVVLTLFSSDGGVGTALADDGIGGDASLQRDIGGLGLIAAAERLERVGGWLSFSTEDEGGSMVRAWVPSFTESPRVER